MAHDLDNWANGGHWIEDHDDDDHPSVGAAAATGGHGGHHDAARNKKKQKVVVQGALGVSEDKGRVPFELEPQEQHAPDFLWVSRISGMWDEQPWK